MTNLIQRAYYSASANEFVQQAPATILGELVARHTFDVDLNQRGAWQVEITHLQQAVRPHPNSHLFLEFAIPRMGKRVDAVLVVGGLIFVIEYKVGATQYQRHANDQVLDYALDLKNFHAGSHDCIIVPILVATNAPDFLVTVNQWADGLVQPLFANENTLSSVIAAALEKLGGSELDPVAWAASPYKPTPTIVEAAQALYQGHDVEEISRSEAGAENLSHTATYISDVIETAKQHGKKAVCFVTGVPGSGKTLAGLNIANERMKAHEDEHAVFLSGNGPLVAVLREALAADELGQAKLKGERVVKKDALRHAGSFVQNIHHFRDEYVATAEAPVERVVVFDEAQRAWTKKQASRFMRDKRGQNEFDMSEPQFLLSVMDRHPNWCVVVCLIGGGQEINTGEAGMGEWLTAIAEHYPDWQVHLSDRLTQADYLGSDQVPPALTTLQTTKTPALHLAVSVRSFRAEALSEFVGAVIDGDADRARSIRKKLDNYPLV
jgi:hypothetical protein